MSQRESKLSRKIMAGLRAEGWFCYKNHGSEYTMAGLPDIVACVEGYFVGLEVKMPESRDNVSATQQHVHSLIEHSGGSCFVVTGVKEAVRVCRDVLVSKQASS